MRLDVWFLRSPIVAIGTGEGFLPGVGEVVDPHVGDVAADDLSAQGTHEPLLAHRKPLEVDPVHRRGNGRDPTPSA